MSNPYQFVRIVETREDIINACISAENRKGFSVVNISIFTHNPHDSLTRCAILFQK